MKQYRTLSHGCMRKVRTYLWQRYQNGERYTIISDYMGRPVEAYNSYGNVVWQADYDIYGDLET